MDMPVYRVTWFFADPVNNVGWTETFQNTAPDGTTALNNLSNYATVRKALLMDTAKITAIRACKADKPRDSLFSSVALPISGTIDHTAHPQMGINDCLLVAWSDVTDRLFSHTFMHEVPAAIFTGRLYVPAGLSGWAASMTAYINEVEGGQYAKDMIIGGMPVSTIIDYGIAKRWTSRKMGRPLDALRGRRAVA
jgi:hypothetical protein